VKILVTGAAGFIGYHVCQILLRNNLEVIGIDNLNNYYDVNLKYARLQELGIPKKKAEKQGLKVHSKKKTLNFSFYKMNIEDRTALPSLFVNEKFDVVCNLAAQAGVRYSLKEPNVYVDSNVVGFLNVLECCRHNTIKHLVYASSSSVYGSNSKIPFAVEDNVDHPISLYAATKKSNELMAHTYSHLFKMPTTGLRFFTVYGPWGRPDMAPFLFTDAISKGNEINVFNYGNMERDFTYVTDIAQGVYKVLMSATDKRKIKNEYYKLYNIGNNRSVKLLDFISEIEANLGLKASKKMLPIQPGDVEKTWANIDALKKDYKYQPKIDIKQGVKNYIEWFKSYYK